MSGPNHAPAGEVPSGCSVIHKRAWVQDGASLEHPVHISAEASIYRSARLGRFSFFNVSTVIYPGVTVGRFVSTGRFCEIGAANHPTDHLSTHLFQFTGSMFPDYPDYQGERQRSIRLHPSTLVGNDVWIGAKAIVRAGVTVGDGAIIGGNALVTKDVPPYAIVGGVPARLIRYRFPEDVIADLLALRWWDLDFSDIKNLPFQDVRGCIAVLKEKRQRDAPQLPVDPPRLVQAQGGRTRTRSSVPSRRQRVKRA